MKRLTLSFAILLVYGISYGQSLEFQYFAQQNVIGVQNGYAIKWNVRTGHKIGLSHQSSEHFSFESGLSNYPFTALEISQPLKKCQGLETYLVIKGGLVDNQFFAVTPELNLTANIGRFIALGFSSGIRARKAAVGLSASIRLSR